jgi:hypothetical protein
MTSHQLEDGYYAEEAGKPRSGHLHRKSMTNTECKVNGPFARRMTAGIGLDCDFRGAQARACKMPVSFQVGGGTGARIPNVHKLPREPGCLFVSDRSWTWAHGRSGNDIPAGVLNYLNGEDLLSKTQALRLTTIDADRSPKAALLSAGDVVALPNGRLCLAMPSAKKACHR